MSLEVLPPHQTLVMSDVLAGLTVYLWSARTKADDGRNRRSDRNMRVSYITNNSGQLAPNYQLSLLKVPAFTMRAQCMMRTSASALWDLKKKKKKKKPTVSVGGDWNTGLRHENRYSSPAGFRGRWADNWEI